MVTWVSSQRGRWLSPKKGGKEGHQGEASASSKMVILDVTHHHFCCLSVKHRSWDNAGDVWIQEAGRFRAWLSQVLSIFFYYFFKLGITILQCCDGFAIQQQEAASGIHRPLPLSSPSTSRPPRPLGRHRVLAFVFPASYIDTRALYFSCNMYETRNYLNAFHSRKDKRWCIHTKNTTQWWDQARMTAQQYGCTSQT